MRFSHPPDIPFNQQVIFPCELTLKTTPKGLRVFRKPVREISTLHAGQAVVLTHRELRAGQHLPLMLSGRQFHIQAEVEIPTGAKLTSNIRGVPVTLTSATLSSDRRSATVQDRVKSVETLIDTTSIETFVTDGELSFTKFVLPNEYGLSVKADGGPVMIRSLTVHSIRSAWLEVQRK